jgi:hypothetical protein
VKLVSYSPHRLSGNLEIVNSIPSYVHRNRYPGHPQTTEVSDVQNSVRRRINRKMLWIIIPHLVAMIFKIFSKNICDDNMKAIINLKAGVSNLAAKVLRAEIVLWHWIWQAHMPMKFLLQQ